MPRTKTKTAPKKYTKPLRAPRKALNPSSPALLQAAPAVDKSDIKVEIGPKVQPLTEGVVQPAAGHGAQPQYARQLGGAYLAKVNDLLTRLRYLGLDQEAEAVAAIVHDLQDVLAQR